MFNFGDLLLGALLVQPENLHMDETTSTHSHDNDHGPVITLGPLSLFQTDGPGEDLHGTDLSIGDLIF